MKYGEMDNNNGDKYKIYAALHEETNAGWVWMTSKEGFESRDYVTIKEKNTGKTVRCICRIIDDNFLTLYNDKARLSIDDNRSIVISDHYRAKLGHIKTNKLYELEITGIRRCNLCHKIRANLMHPDNVVILTTYLALFSLVLGIIGSILGILGIIF